MDCLSESAVQSHPHAFSPREAPSNPPFDLTRLMNILDKIMKPRSIAVVGASTKQHTIGSDIMKRLREYG